MQVRQRTFPARLAAPWSRLPMKAGQAAWSAVPYQPLESGLQRRSRHVSESGTAHATDRPVRRWSWGLRSSCAGIDSARWARERDTGVSCESHCRSLDRDSRGARHRGGRLPLPFLTVEVSRLRRIKELIVAPSVHIPSGINPPCAGLARRCEDQSPGLGPEFDFRRQLCLLQDGFGDPNPLRIADSNNTGYRHVNTV